MPAVDAPPSIESPTLRAAVVHEAGKQVSDESAGGQDNTHQ